MNAIRPATQADAAAIASVHVASWRETYTDVLPAELIARNTLELRTALWSRVLGDPARDVRVATSAADGLAGFVCGGPMPESIRGRAPIPEHDAYVFALYVLAHEHGRGLGRALLREVAAALAADGARSLALHVVATNPAVRFYERLGARFIRAEALSLGVDEGVQLAYGWSDLRALL